MTDGRKVKGEGIMYHHGQTREREKKKVGWKKNLSTSESFNGLHVEDRSPNWDNETGNMLSYFLGDPLTGGENYAAATEPTIPNPRIDYEIPPTPATMYYYHSASKPRASNEENTTLNNPLMKMKVSHTDDRGPAGDQPTGGVLSPISPTSMIGPCQEPLMLPPSPNSQNEAYKNHINWLRKINTVANGAQRVEPSHPAETRSMPVMPPHAGVAMPRPLQYNTVPPMQPVPLPPTAVNPVLYTHAALIQKQVSSAGESEEKRAKRLERNRESARRSRRKKKERLSTLEEKVSNLYQRIEKERRRQINVMDDALNEDLADSVSAMRTIVVHTSEGEQREKLTHFLQSTGMNSQVRRAVLDFQYPTLKQTILPPYHKFVLWLTLNPEKFFTHARDSHVIQDTKKSRPPAGKLSSKQIGEELTGSDKGEKVNQTARAVDEGRMWPLLCFELSVSVDQEEKMLHALKKVRQLQFIDEQRSQMEAATKMASNLKEAMTYQSQAESIRNTKALTEILTPQQALKYKEWMRSNRDRCKETFEKRMRGSGSSSQPIDKTSLSDVCKKLEKILISQGDPANNGSHSDGITF